MKPILTLLCLCLLITQVSAQSFEVPKNPDLSKEENFKKYEKDVVNAENWLESTPVEKDIDKRKEATGFIINWLSGVPYISINIRAEVMPFSESSKEMLIYFMGGWGKYAIEHPKDTSAASGSVAGLKSVIKVYKANTSIKRDKNIDKLVTLNDKGKLESWVAEQLK